MIDSGADANIVSASDWETLSREVESGKVALYDVVKNPSVKLSAYAADTKLKVIAEFKAWIGVCGYDELRTFAKFFVVMGGNRSLLGRKTSLALKVLKVGVEINEVEEQQLEFPSIPGVEVDFDVDETVPAVRHAYVSIPAHFHEAAVQRLKKMEREGIISRVSEAPKWLSGLSAVAKGKGDFRLVVNMRGPNRAIRRQYHRMPRLEEIKTKLCGAKWFSALDLSNAFHHIRLSEKSSSMTTFMTPDGMYKFNRLVFGVNCAPEIFQREMERILEGITNIVVYIDDILIYARSLGELEEVMLMVMTRLKENNLTLNQAKCQFKKESLTFLGHKLTSEGLHVDERKTKDIGNFRRPRSLTELKSFIGLANYLRDYVPHFSDLTLPLREVEKKKTFEWTKEADESFEATKRAIVNCTVTQGYFDVKDKTELYTDASPYGLGAVLVQINQKGDKRIIAFASKSLTPTEQRYAQSQREALAIVWATENFYYYLLGAKFTIKTDAEGIKFIFDKSSDKPKRMIRRAEGWAMRLDRYDYDIVSISGKANIADPPSRLVVNHEAPMQFNESETPGEIARIEIMEIDDIMFAEDHLPSLEIAMETAKCSEMQQVIASLESGVWTEDLRMYSAVKNELEVIAGVVVRDGLAVIPPKLRSKALQIAHKGHLGRDKTKSVLKDRVWFPKMDLAVEELIKSCNACIVNGQKHPPTPMKRTELPEAPWDFVAMDYCGPFASLRGIHVICLVDYFSRYVTAGVVKSTSWKDLQPILDETFGKFGYPKQLKSDNGPPFSGVQYKKYCEERGIENVFSWPLNPQQNGMAEATMKHVNRAVQNASAEGRDAYECLKERIQAHNDAPHRETGAVPSQVMFGRHLRRGLPLMKPAGVLIDSASLRETDWAAKMKGKAQQDKRRHAREMSIEVGDSVVLERQAKKKGETRYDPRPLTVESAADGDLVLRDSSGVMVRRDVTKVKKVPEQQPGSDDNNDGKRPMREARKRTREQGKM